MIQRLHSTNTGRAPRDDNFSVGAYSRFSQKCIAGIHLRWLTKAILPMDTHSIYSCGEMGNNTELYTHPICRTEHRKFNIHKKTLQPSLEGLTKRREPCHREKCFQDICGQWEIQISLHGLFRAFIVYVQDCLTLCRI